MYVPGFRRSSTMITFFVLSIAMILTIGACEEAATDNGGPSQTYEDPAEELTKSISFAGGTVRRGRPPKATNKPGDPRITGASTTATVLSRGSEGSLSIGFSDVPRNTRFDVNVRFDDANSYVNIPVSQSITKGRSSGTLDLPFSVPTTICDNVQSTRHEITSYESVSVGGTRVSAEQKRQVVLNCNSGSEVSGVGSFCAYNYPKAACDLIQSIYLDYDHLFATFVPGRGAGTCSGFPNVASSYDYGYDAGAGFSLCNDPEYGPCGACVIGWLDN